MGKKKRNKRNPLYHPYPDDFTQHDACLGCETKHSTRQPALHHYPHENTQQANQVLMASTLVLPPIHTSCVPIQQARMPPTKVDKKRRRTRNPLYHPYPDNESTQQQTKQFGVSTVLPVPIQEPSVPPMKANPPGFHCKSQTDGHIPRVVSPTDELAEDKGMNGQQRGVPIPGGFEEFNDKVIEELKAELKPDYKQNFEQHCLESRANCEQKLQRCQELADE